MALHNDALTNYRYLCVVYSNIDTCLSYVLADLLNQHSLTEMLYRERIPVRLHQLQMVTFSNDIHHLTNPVLMVIS